MNSLEKKSNGFLENLYLIPFILLGIQFMMINHKFFYSYLYDSEIYEGHEIIQPYLESLHACGQICNDLVTSSVYLREEDYVPSILGFVVNKSKFLFYFIYLYI